MSNKEYYDFRFKTNVFNRLHRNNIAIKRIVQVLYIPTYISSASFLLSLLYYKSVTFGNFCAILASLNVSHCLLGGILFCARTFLNYNAYEKLTNFDTYMMGPLPMLFSTLCYVAIAQSHLTVFLPVGVVGMLAITMMQQKTIMKFIKKSQKKFYFLQILPIFAANVLALILIILASDQLKQSMESLPVEDIEDMLAISNEEMTIKFKEYEKKIDMEALLPFWNRCESKRKKKVSKE